MESGASGAGLNIAQSLSWPPPEHLVLWWDNQIVGWLWQDQDGLLSFAYSPEWRAAGTLPVSRSLPKQDLPYRGRLVEAFFANLLPEGDMRVAVARALQKSENNHYGLLEALGGDCAGALTLSPPGSPPPEHTPQYEILSPQALENWVKNLPSQPLLTGKGDMRMSLAGAQPKLALCRLGGNDWAKPVDGAISTHILKPPLLREEGSVENEFFCMRLAKAVGLNVPECSIQESPLAYVIARYDRKRDEVTGKVSRIHQEDFCQVLGIASSNKYESEGGPGLRQCFDVVRSNCTGLNKPKALKQLQLWVVFNFVIGNHDAHGKNLSLIYVDDGIQLAPFYDLLSTAIYPTLNEKFAMKIGKARSVRDYLYAGQWQAMANACGLNETLFVQDLVRISRKIQKKAVKLASSKVGQVGPVIPQIIAVIDERVRLIERIVEAQKKNLNRLADADTGG